MYADWMNMKNLVKENRFSENFCEFTEKLLLYHPAEEALSSLVIARKLCFGSRSEYGRAWRVEIQSCIETLHRQGSSILDFLADAIRAYRYRNPCPDIQSI